MLHRLKEKLLWHLSFAMPATLAYYVAVRVVCHASVTKYRETPMPDIGAADALGWWYDSKVGPRSVASDLVAPTS